MYKVIYQFVDKNHRLRTMNLAFFVDKPEDARKQAEEFLKASGLQWYKILKTIKN